MKRVAAIAAGLTAMAAPAWAGIHVISYDSASPLTEAVTEQGLTFVFDKGVIGERVLKIVETNDIGEADLKPAAEYDLGPGGLTPALGADAQERQLYEITDAADGKALKRALCQSSRVWLAMGRLKVGLPLRVRAVALDPDTHKARLCVTLDYLYHGEWALQPPLLPQPDRTDRFNDAPNNTRF